MTGKIIAGSIGGFIVAALAGNVVNLISDSKSAIAFVAAWVIAIYITKKSANGLKAWRKLLVLCSALSFMVPLAALIYTTRQTEGTSVLGGLVATGILGVVFFLLGLAFFVIRIFVGRDTARESPSVKDRENFSERSGERRAKQKKEEEGKPSFRRGYDSD